MREEFGLRHAIVLTIAFTAFYIAISNAYFLEPLEEVEVLLEYRDINMKELKWFILQDDTDKNVYTEDYKCIDFSKDLIKNAEKYGIRGYLVILSNGEESHAVVAFDVVDNEYTVYVEPQNDKFINPTTYLFSDKWQ